MIKAFTLAALFWVAASLVGASSIYETTVLGNNPVAFFPLNETSGTTANNLASGSENGTYTGGVTLGVTGGPGGTGAGFTPTGEYVSIPIYSALQVTNAFSMEAWIDVTTANASDDTIFAINRSASGTGIGFSVYQNQLTLALNNFSTNYVESAATQILNGQWEQVAVTWGSNVNGGAPQFYINGALVANANTNKFTQSLNLGSAPAANIGVEFANGANGGRWFQGDIGEVAYYNTVLTADQISADYTAGAPEPSSLGLAAGGLLVLLAAARRR